MRRRGLAAVAILVLWVTGLGFLVRRELFRPDHERFAEMGLRVTPGATYYAVAHEGRHVGFASSTLDTTDTGIQIIEHLVADLPGAGGERRTSARTRVRLSRGMRLRDFHLQLDSRDRKVTAQGEVTGDSVVTLVVQQGAAAAPDTHRVRLDGPALLPNLIPLVVALEERPEVGTTRPVPVIDPLGRASTTVAVTIAAESLFVVYDSSGFNPATDRWEGLLPDTVRAWHLAGADPASLQGWVDAQGRLVASTQGALTLERMPYELAFENWQRAKKNRAAPVARADERLLAATVITAGTQPARGLERMRLVLRGADLVGFDLRSDRQALRGDTLTVVRDAEARLRAPFALGAVTRDMSREKRSAMRPYLAEAPLVEIMDPDVRGLAMQLRGGDRDPRVVAERIHDWVRDSLAERATSGIPSAAAVLRARAGDVHDHAQLYVALARAAGIPARVTAGFLHVDGRFHYHAWPEVYFGTWVAVDPALGQFPADAAHVRFTTGSLDRQAELLQLIGNLEIEVLDAR